MKIKKFLTMLSGLIYGTVSAWFMLLAFLFITHPDSSPGTKDWSEDVMFIPIGYLILIFLVITALLILRRMKANKKNTILFFCSTLTGLAVFFIYVSL